MATAASAARSACSKDTNRFAGAQKTNPMPVLHMRSAKSLVMVLSAAGHMALTLTLLRELAVSCNTWVLYERAVDCETPTTLTGACVLTKTSR